MIADYLNQNASWQSKTGNNSYGEPTYGAATTIYCRFEAKHSLVRNANGVVIDSMAKMYCVENILEGDLITYPTTSGRAYVVLQVTDQPLVDGTINHREVYL